MRDYNQNQQWSEPRCLTLPAENTVSLSDERRDMHQLVNCD